MIGTYANIRADENYCYKLCRRGVIRRPDVPGPRGYDNFIQRAITTVYTSHCANAHSYNV